MTIITAAKEIPSGRTPGVTSGEEKEKAWEDFAPKKRCGKCKGEMAL